MPYAARTCLPPPEWIVGNSYRDRINPAARLKSANWPDTEFRETCLLVAQDAQSLDEESAVLELSGMGR